MIGKLAKRMKERRLMQQASRDVARVLSGTIDVRDIRRVEKMGAAQARYQEEYRLNAHLMAEFSALENDPEILAVVDSQIPSSTLQAQALRSTIPRSDWWPALAIAATLALAIGAAWFAAYEPPGKAQSLRYITRVGEIKTVDLPDGSRVTLNTDTQLMVSYSDSFRDLALLKGEAFFDVAGDPHRPFSVALGSRDVTVLGTQFNIRKTPESFTLAVMAGAVSLHPTGEAVLAGAALLSVAGEEVLRISQGGQRRIEANTVVEFNERKQELTAYQDPHIRGRQSWQQGYLRFVEAPLSEVIAELNRYSSKPIVIVNPGVGELKLTGTLRVDQISQTLAGIEQSLPIKVVRQRDRWEVESGE